MLIYMDMSAIKIQTGGRSYDINTFVKKKLQRFDSMERDFASLFTLMFSEDGNTLYELWDGSTITRITYGQARSAALIRAAALKPLLKDAPADSVVGLCMSNGPAWIETFWAILACGMSPLLINLNLGDEEIADALSKLDAAAVISDGKRFSTETIDAASLLGGQDEYEPGSFGTKLFVMSSGTSSHIKICAYGAEEIYHQIRDSYRIIKRCRKLKGFYKGQLKQLDLLPFYHIFGLVAMYIWFAFFSRTFVHLNDLRPETILGTVNSCGVTHIFAVPMFWDKIYEQAIKTIKERGNATYDKFMRALDLSEKLSAIPPLSSAFSHLAFREVRQNLFGESIRFMITGGSNIRPEVLKFFNGIGYRLANGYGMSEIGICSVELSGRGKILDNGFVGQSLSSLSYSINDDGELIVSGKTMACYIIEDGKKTMRPDSFNTHDLAECEKGHYKILGRRDDLVIGPDGENLNPNLIENMFSHELLRETCLIDESGPLLLCSVPQGISKDDYETVKQYVRDAIAKGPVAGKIRRLEFTTDALVESGQFKANRRRIRERYRDHALSMIEKRTFEGSDIPDDDLYKDIACAFAKALGKDVSEISLNDDFFLDLSGTSLDYFALITDLHDKYDTSFPIVEGKTLNTVEQFYRHISSGSDDADTFSESLC